MFVSVGNGMGIGKLGIFVVVYFVIVVLCNIVGNNVVVAFMYFIVVGVVEK